MDIYLIKDRLEPCTLDQAVKREYPYVCAAEADEFQHNASFFDLGMDLELDLAGLTTTKAEVNFDSVIGTFDIPDRRDLTADHSRFAFAFDEKGIVFIGGGDYVREKIASIIRLKKWRFPSLERFLFDFLEQITDDDLRILEAYDARLDAMEDRIQASDLEDIPDRIADIRGCVSDLNLHYGQLLDLTQELEENENSYFAEENLRYFSMYASRIRSLKEIASSVKDHCIQVRELHQVTMDARQNRLMAILTVVATIFMPLTLVTGWYGMNFVYMPELHYQYAYPMVFGLCVAIVTGCVWWFKKNKWL